MNCTVCGKPHTPEAPLTIAHNNELLCPGCLKELDTYSRPTGFVRSDRMLSADEIRKAVITTNGTVKIGNMELPIESFELR